MLSSRRFRLVLFTVTLSDMLALIIQMLNAEQSIHRPELKKLKCELCGKVFETPDMLSYHRSVEHSQGRRPPIGVS